MERNFWFLIVTNLNKSVFIFFNQAVLFLQVDCTTRVCRLNLKSLKVYPRWIFNKLSGWNKIYRKKIFSSGNFYFEFLFETFKVLRRVEEGEYFDKDFLVQSNFYVDLKLLLYADSKFKSSNYLKLE